MIFLLPPSETKQLGGLSTKAPLAFPELNPARAMVYRELIDLCKDSDAAAKSLKLGAKQLGEIAHNLALGKSKTMPAIKRYTGVLYEALNTSALKTKELSRAGKHVFIQSSLFGLISATDPIPYYRLSAGSKLPTLNLKQLWSQAHRNVWEKFADRSIVDMRSKAYADLAPLPDNLPSYYLSVVLENSNGEREQLNHFNKKAKGLLIAAVLRSTRPVSTLAELKVVAKVAGMKLEAKGNQLLLITYG